MEGQKQICLVLVAVCLIGIQCTQAWSLFDKDHSLNFDAINQYLVENVRGDDVDDVDLNMNQASKWLDQKRAAGKKNSLVKALEAFVSLMTIASPEKCDLEGYKILSTVNDGTKGNAIKRLTTIRRIDKLVRHYSIKHAQVCFAVYPEILAKKKAELSPGVEEKLEKLKYYNRIALTYRNKVLSLPTDEEFTYSDVAIESEMFKIFDLYYPIKSLAENDPDLKYLGKVEDQVKGTMVINEVKLRELFNKYVLEPCKEFDEKIGQFLSAPVDFDIQITYSTGVNGATSQLISDKFSMSICEKMLNKKYRELTIRNLIEEIGYNSRY